MTAEESQQFLCECLRHRDANVRKLAEMALRMSTIHELIVKSLRNAGIQNETRTPQ